MSARERLILLETADSLLIRISSKMGRGLMKASLSEAEKTLASFMVEKRIIFEGRVNGEVYLFLRDPKSFLLN